MTKNEFKQQLIISIAGSDYLRTSDDIVSKADNITKAAEKDGITFDGDTRQPSSDDTKYRKGMQNAVVINGTVYELVDVNPKEREQSECETCALREECNSAADVICVMLFGDKTSADRHFKKL